MRQIDFLLALTAVTARSGLPMERHGGAPDLSAFPSEYNPLQTFVLSVRPGLREMSARLELGHYAADLLAAINSASVADRLLCAQLAESYEARGWRINARDDGKTVSLNVPSEWPSGWKAFCIDIAVDVLIQELTDEAATELAADLMSAAVALFLCLAAEDRELLGEQEAQIPEGARSSVVVNKYERSRAARMACLERYGYRCAACHVLMSERYGIVHKEIIHVHHIVPVSMLHDGYLFEPLRDLVPMCPNCHAVAHSKEPPLSASAIRAMLDSSSHHSQGKP